MNIWKRLETSKGCNGPLKAKKRKNLQKNHSFFSCTLHHLDHVVNALRMWCGGNQRSVSKKNLDPWIFQEPIKFSTVWTWVNLNLPIIKLALICEFDSPQIRQPTLDIVIYYYIIIIAKCKCAPGLTMKCFVPLLFFFFVCVTSPY